MNKHAFGKFNVSELAFGMWTTAECGMDVDQLHDFLCRLSELDINLLDTAAIYGAYHRSEAALGAVLVKYPALRNKFTIVSKCGIEVRSQTPHYDNSKEYILTQVHESLDALRIASLDVLLLHRPDIFMDFDSVYQAFRELKDEGKVAEFGVSNYTPEQFKALYGYLNRRGIRLITNQIELNAFTDEHYRNDNTWYLKGEAIHPMIWSPLGKGQLFDDNDVSYGIRSLAEKNNATVTQIMISYLTSQGLNPIILLGSHKIERYIDAIKGLELKLTHEEMYYILKLFRKENVR
jgi:predicted oxidoreductase